MNIDLLSYEERQKTRKLYEEVFFEDSSNYVDYYYSHKILTNKILGILKNQEYISMLHLNPYILSYGKERMLTHYIVAVATKKEFRGQKMMQNLLVSSMEKMYQNQEAFTWLMPAHEDIYLPYGFRHIHQKNKYVFYGKRTENNRYQFQPIKENQLEARGEQITRFLEKEYQIFAIRDVEYLKGLIAEVKAESGNVIDIYQGERREGFFAYAIGEEHIEVRDFFWWGKKIDCYQKLWDDFVTYLGQNQKIILRGAIKGYQPQASEVNIMARGLYLPKLIRPLRSYGQHCVEVDIIDGIIEENTGAYRFLINEDGASLERIGRAGERKCRLTIEDLTSLTLTGRILPNQGGTHKRVYTHNVEKMYSSVINGQLQEIIESIQGDYRSYFTEVV